jgi:hypothetical protein
VTAEDGSCTGRTGRTGNSGSDGISQRNSCSFDRVVVHAGGLQRVWRRFWRRSEGKNIKKKKKKKLVNENLIQRLTG